jgi:hypothetical protein
MIYAFSCTSLSGLDLSQGVLATGSVVPIVRLHLSFQFRPDIFDLLHTYLYTRSTDALVDRLMPRSVDDLASAVHNVQELWRLVVAFGVADSALWDAMDLVYTGSLGKMIRQKGAELVSR